MAKVPEQVASGVYRVDAGPYSNAISVLLIADEEGWALVDTGSAASPFRIQGALASLEVAPDELKRIYLTHHHPDHIGGLPAVLWWARQAEVVAPRLEARIISGSTLQTYPLASSAPLFLVGNRCPPRRSTELLMKVIPLQDFG